MNTRRMVKNQAGQHKPGESGIALITMLLLLSLLTALGLSMVMVFRSDMVMNAYNRTFRASNYAADAGITIVRQDMINRLYADLPVGGPAFGAASPLTVTNSAASQIVTVLNGNYGGSAVAINSTSSFPESFQLQTANLTLTSCAVSWYTSATSNTQGVGSGVPIPATPTTCYVPVFPAVAYGFKYIYQYTITAVGKVMGAGGTAATETGTITVKSDNNDTPNNFSQYGTFIDQNPICTPGGGNNSELVGGTYTGTLFTNGSWNYGQGQTYTFTGKVESVGADAGYLYSDGTCDNVAGPKDTYNMATVAPTFDEGQQLGLKQITLPTDSINQKSAVLTGKGLNADGTPASTPTAGDMTAALVNYNGSAYTGPSDTGVFLPANTTTGTLSGGGIYVEGDAAVSLSTSANGQVYTITQGSSPAVITTITITPTPGTGTTVIKQGGTTKTYTGVPTQMNPNTSTTTDAALLYVDGNVTSLSGTVQNGTGLTITALDNITITGNVMYATPVVYTSTDGVTPPSGYSVGSETAAAAAGSTSQSLGLLTTGGSILLKAPTNGANMEVDASIMTTGSMSGPCNMGSTCTGVLGVTGSNTIGTLNIVGGRIQSQAMVMPSGTIGTRNVYFDPRYNGTFAPPFFPVVTINNATPTTQVTVQRTGWVMQTAY